MSRPIFKFSLFIQPCWWLPTCPQVTGEHIESEAPTEATVEAAEDKMSGEEEKPSSPDPENQESLDEDQPKVQDIDS